MVAIQNGQSGRTRRLLAHALQCQTQRRSFASPCSQASKSSIGIIIRERQLSSMSWPESDQVLAIILRSVGISDMQTHSPEEECHLSQQLGKQTGVLWKVAKSLDGLKRHAHFLDTLESQNLSAPAETENPSSTPTASGGLSFENLHLLCISPSKQSCVMESFRREDECKILYEAVGLIRCNSLGPPRLPGAR